MRIVDLFSGAGGLTFGFYYNLIDGQFVKNENCNIVFANEYDIAAAEAFRQNFPDVNMINRDIKLLSEQEVLDMIGDEEIDLIVGGPPCQSYSYIGKRVYDDKAKLYNEYFRMLSIIRPRMFLFENVKGMLSMKDSEGKLIIKDIEEKFAHINDDLGYNIILWLAGLNSISKEIYESAKVDGANNFQCFTKITLPCLKPTLYTVAVLSLLNSFKVFREAYLVAGDYPDKSMYLLQHLFNNWFRELDFSKMAAASVLMAAIIFILIMLLQRAWENQD